MHKPSVLRGNAIRGTVSVVLCLLIEPRPAYRKERDELGTAGVGTAGPWSGLKFLVRK